MQGLTARLSVCGPKRDSWDVLSQMLTLVTQGTDASLSDAQGAGL